MDKLFDAFISELENIEKKYSNTYHIKIKNLKILQQFEIEIDTTFSNLEEMQNHLNTYIEEQHQLTPCGPNNIPEEYILCDYFNHKILLYIKKNGMPVQHCNVIVYSRLQIFSKFIHDINLSEEIYKILKKIEPIGSMSNMFKYNNTDILFKF